jgi:transcriptional regulator with XRE-family HTH domain
LLFKKGALMNKTATILKTLRKQRNLTQAEISKGIISRQSYSKIENGDIPPTIDVLFLLLERLNLDYVDFMREYNKENEFTKQKAIFYKALNKKQITEEKIQLLYQFVNKNKHRSNQYYHFYGIVKGHLHSKYPHLVPNFTKKDKQELKNYILTLNEHYSLYDIKLIADFAGILYPYDDFKKMVKKIDSLDPFAYAENMHSYLHYLQQIYNNLTDIAIREKDFLTAEQSLKKHKDLLEIHPDVRQSIYYEINRLSNHYLQTKDKTALKRIKKYAKVFKNISDYQTYKAINKQTKVMKRETKIDPQELITYA